VNFNSSKLILACLAAAIFNSCLFAAEPEGIILDSGVRVTPLVETGLIFDDNILSQSSGENDSSILTIAPSVVFLLDDGVNNYEFDLGIEKGYVDSSSEDNYLDAYMAFSSHLEAGMMSRWDIYAELSRETEARGTGLTEATPDRFNEPLEYDIKTAAIDYEYGALTTQMRIAFELKFIDKEYKNFKSFTAAKDKDSVKFGSTFFYSTNSKTDAFIELSQNRIRYDQIDYTGISRDSDDIRALVGVQWEPSAFLTATIKLGQQKKSFTDSGRKDFSGLSWSFGVDWNPLTYTTVSLEYSKAAKDPYLQGDYINETAIDISWKHRWSDELSSKFAFSNSEEDYGGFAVARNDDTQTLDLSVSYSVLRWLDISLFAKYIDKDSTRTDILYDKTVVGLNFIVSI